MRLNLGGCSTSRLLHLPARILKVYRGLKTFSHLYCPDALSITFLSPGYSFEYGSHCGKGGKNLCSKDRRMCEEPSIGHDVQFTGQPAVIAS